MFNYKSDVKRLITMARAYYVYDNPVASDEEYDKLYHQCLEYEKKNPNDVDAESPTQRVGGVVTDKFKKLPHLNRMWSQQDIFTEDELGKWLENVLRYSPSIIGSECKFDGLSLKLIYVDGKLKTASTRGDGFIGEDVTINAKTVKSIPLTIPITRRTVEINGEIVIHKEDFNKLNKEREDKSLPLFVNARNAAAGSMRLLDSKETSKRGLVFYPWQIIGAYDFLTAEEVYALTTLFKPNPITFTANRRDLETLTNKDHRSILAGLMDHYRKFMQKRSELDVEIDGVIFKVLDEDPRIYDEIGYTAKFPKWSCAFKFPAVEKTTRVINVIQQVGRTGKITPVAILEPILIDGSTVERVTLHNYSEVRLKDLRVGDSIILIKSGDIIPKITKVFKDRRTGSEQIVIEPTHCPKCNTPVVREEIFIKCPNELCSSRKAKYIEFFAGRDYMNIDGLGPSVVDALLENNKIDNVVDLYKLTYNDLTSIDGFKDKKIKNLINGIENSKQPSLDKFMASLGIPGFGRTISKQVVELFGYDVMRMTYDDLVNIPGIGEEIAKNYVEFMEKNKVWVTELFVTVKPKVITKVTAGRFKDQIVVLTGSMEKGKDTIKNLVEDNGGTVKNSVTKDTTLVIYGDKAGSKLDKAKSLGIETKYYKDV